MGKKQSIEGSSAYKKDIWILIAFYQLPEVMYSLQNFHLKRQRKKKTSQLRLGTDVEEGKGNLYIPLPPVIARSLLFYGISKTFPY